MATGTMKPPRKPVPSKNETAVLSKSARRCPLCFHFSGDLTEKVGQIAHLDGDRTNGAEDNLAWMCMPHHSQYDSTTSQHKNYTLAEVKTHRSTLYEAIARGERGPVSVPVTGVQDKGGEHDTREDRYLLSTDAELGSAIKEMVWASAWGKWFSAQLLANQDRPIDKKSVDGQVMQIAASLVTDAATDGKLEIRGRPPDSISYEVIPREAWRLIALHMRPDSQSLWRVMVIPRGGAEILNGTLQTQTAARVAHIFAYDSLIVNSRQFEQLWPKKDRATDRARRRLLQTAERKGVVDHDLIIGLRG